MKTARFYSLEEARTKMEGYCSYQDRCHKEVEDKLYEMGMIPEAKEQIITHLIEQDYLNEERFALAFTRSKFNQKHWGRLRLKRELYRRDISRYLIDKALSHIGDEEYREKINWLADKRWDQLGTYKPIVQKKKLFDYLAYRGWESHLIYDCIRELSGNK